MEKQANKNKKIYIIGVLLILLGSSSFLYRYVNEKIDVAYEMMNKELIALQEDTILNNEISNEQESNNEENQQEVQEEQEQKQANELNREVINYYIGYLEIPKINLYRGFVDKESDANNVRINVKIITPSDYPDVEKGNFILASHSGNGYNAYFRDLYKLSNGDKAYIYYNNKKYTYQITNIYLQPKIGTVTIFRDHTKTNLTLITCTQNDESTQTLYILDLISIE